MSNVPDRVVFCDALDKDGAQIQFGDLRQNSAEDFHLQCLEKRLVEWLVGQGEHMQRERVSPFPLTITTLAGMSALGEIFFGDEFPTSSDERDKNLFVHVCGRVSQRLSHKPEKKFATAFAARWSVNKPTTIGGVLYTYLRNPLIHNFHGKAVFITGDETEDVSLDDAGFVLLNPFWLFSRFKCAAETLCDRARHEEQNGPLRRNALQYVGKLLE